MRAPSDSRLTLFSDRLFAAPADGHSGDARILSLVEEARIQLRRQAGKLYESLPHTAQQDFAHSLSGLLARLLLFELAPAVVLRAVRNWVNAQCEMLSRLQVDHRTIEEVFDNGRSYGDLMRVALGMSDPHDGGRTAAVLTFESGLKLVYKPRDVGIERWYFQFMRRLNSLGTPQPFRPVEVLCRPGYGWEQFIPHVRCRSEEGLARFYRNGGALLCLLHVLAASDGHFQNLIACGDDPVMIDAETLFQPQLSDNDSNSVEASGMIPNWRFGPQDEAYDVSSLGFVSPRLTHFSIPVWTADGVQFKIGTLFPEHNVPFPSVDPPHPEEYVEEMISGFHQTYQFLLDHRPYLLAQVQDAAGLHVRYVFRETIEYYETLNSALELQQSPAVHLPPLPRPRAVLDQLRETEVHALKQLDIPRFTRTVGSRDLCGVEDCFLRSGSDRVAERIEHLSAEDLAQQEQFIRLSWSLFRLSSALR